MLECHNNQSVYSLGLIVLIEGRYLCRHLRRTRGHREKNFNSEAQIVASESPCGSDEFAKLSSINWKLCLVCNGR